VRPKMVLHASATGYLCCDLSESHVGLLAAVGAVRPKGQPILRLSMVSVRP
jgi:hypothetical protein